MAEPFRKRLASKRLVRTLLIVGLDLERSSRLLTGPVRERLAVDEMGDLVSGVVAPWVAHDALHLIVTNPVTGTVSFSFWHGYPRDLAYAEMRNAYLGDDPVSPHVLAARHMSVGVLNALAPDDLQARAILRAHRIGSELRLMLRDARAVWGILCLFREEGGRRFTSKEAEQLCRLTPALIAALRGYVTATPMPLLTQHPPAGVILFDANHEMQGISAQAETWLAALRASEWLSCPQWAAMALASEAAQGNPQLCVPAAHTGCWVTMHAQPLGPGGDVAVLVQAAAGELLLPALATWYGITPREQAVLNQLRIGLAPKQIARRLRLSTHTVNDYLKALYHKLGVSGRDELIAAVG